MKFISLDLPSFGQGLQNELFALHCDGFNRRVCMPSMTFHGDGFNHRVYMLSLSVHGDGLELGEGARRGDSQLLHGSLPGRLPLDGQDVPISAHDAQPCDGIALGLLWRWHVGHCDAADR